VQFCSANAKGLLLGLPERRGRRPRFGFALQFYEDDVRRCGADVLAGVRLGVQPPDLGRLECDLARLVAGREAAVEPARAEQPNAGPDRNVEVSPSTAVTSRSA
jgi:hypothetical protein